MQGDNHTDVVAMVKTALVGRGVNLAGPCGAFEITKRVAWLLRDEGAGLLAKPAGNNCQGYSVDYIVYRNGQGFDMLGDAGGENVPAWGGGEIDPTFPDRWRSPFDPSDVVSPPPPPPPPAGGGGADGRMPPGGIELLALFDQMANGIDRLAQGVNALAARVGSLEENGVRFKFR